jgi:hypothetical protein
MNKIITYHIWPRDIKFEEKLGLITDFTEKRKLKPSSKHRSCYRIELDPFQRVTSYDVEEFLDLMKHAPTFDSFMFESWFTNPKEEDLCIGITYYPVNIEVSVNSDDIDLLEATHIFIRDKLSLRNPEVCPYDDTRAKYLHPTVFIGRHFDKAANEYPSALSTFLELLGFDVKQGEAYASTTIPEKVKARIDAQDIFLCVISGKKGHPWLVAEPAYALGKGKHIVLLVEEGTDYDPTILGKDLEQVRFPPGHIEKTFIPLLAEFRSVRIKGL